MPANIRAADDSADSRPASQNPAQSAESRSLALRAWRPCFGAFRREPCCASVVDPASAKRRPSHALTRPSACGCHPWSWPCRLRRGRSEPDRQHQQREPAAGFDGSGHSDAAGVHQPGTRTTGRSRAITRTRERTSKPVRKEPRSAHGRGSPVVTPGPAQHGQRETKRPTSIRRRTSAGRSRSVPSRQTCAARRARVSMLSTRATSRDARPAPGGRARA